MTTHKKVSSYHNNESISFERRGLEFIIISQGVRILLLSRRHS